MSSSISNSMYNVYVLLARTVAATLYVAVIVVAIKITGTLSMLDNRVRLWRFFLGGARTVIRIKVLAAF